jgi:hypothetical protein
MTSGCDKNRLYSGRRVFIIKRLHHPTITLTSTLACKWFCFNFQRYSVPREYRVNKSVKCFFAIVFVSVLWIGIVSMPIRIRNLIRPSILIPIRTGSNPKFYTWWKNRKIWTFAHCSASLNCLIFFVSVITVRGEIRQPVDAKMRQLF